MTTSDKVKLIRQTGSLSFRQGNGDLAVTVTIVDVRESFGRVDYQVAPVAGSGRAWVAADSVKIESVKTIGS